MIDVLIFCLKWTACRVMKVRLMHVRMRELFCIDFEHWQSNLDRNILQAPKTSFAQEFFDGSPILLAGFSESHLTVFSLGSLIRFVLFNFFNRGDVS